MLAIAVRRDMACAVCFEGARLKDWTVSHKAARSPQEALQVLSRWVDLYSPDVVVSQNPDSATRKSAHNREILSAIGCFLEDGDVQGLLVTRTYGFDNIYDEAAAIAVRYPDLQHKLPKKPRLWETEPRRIIYFEAMALALHVIDREPSA